MDDLFFTYSDTHFEECNYSSQFLTRDAILEIIRDTRKLFKQMFHNVVQISVKNFNEKFKTFFYSIQFKNYETFYASMEIFLSWIWSCT